MTFVVEGKNSHFFGASAQLLSGEESTASWTSNKIVHNPALTWVLANYVEADSPNSNGQLWALNDLRMAKPSIAYAPMNIDHKSNYIVGTFVDSELVYPSMSDKDGAVRNPFIEVLGCVWKAYSKQALEDINRAYEQASLYVSMECVAETVTCMTPGGCGQSFAYQGPWSPTYCECMQHQGRIQRLDNPHFLAGALILPPNRPGWTNAEVKHMAELVKEYADEAETIHNELSTQTDIEDDQLESLTLAVLEHVHERPRLSPEAIGKIVAATKV